MLWCCDVFLSLYLLTWISINLTLLLLLMCFNPVWLLLLLPCVRSATVLRTRRCKFRHRGICAWFQTRLLGRCPIRPCIRTNWRETLCFGGHTRRTASLGCDTFRSLCGCLLCRGHLCRCFRQRTSWWFESRLNCYQTVPSYPRCGLLRLLRLLRLLPLFSTFDAFLFHCISLLWLKSFQFSCRAVRNGNRRNFHTGGTEPPVKKLLVINETHGHKRYMTVYLLYFSPLIYFFWRWHAWHLNVNLVVLCSSRNWITMTCWQIVADVSG